MKRNKVRHRILSFLFLAVLVSFFSHTSLRAYEQAPLLQGHNVVSIGAQASYSHQSKPLSRRLADHRQASKVNKLHIKARPGGIYSPTQTLTKKQKRGKTALDHDQFQIGANLSRETSVYLTTSFQDNQHSYLPEGWSRHCPSQKSFIMPGIGFEWRPQKKINLLKYQLKMPEKISLSGELRADIMKKNSQLDSLKNFPSRVRFNAVLFKVHYTLGKKSP